MRTSHFLVQKSFGFFEIYRVLHGQGEGGLSQIGHFSDKGEGVNFSQFVRTSLMDGP